MTNSMAGVSSLTVTYSFTRPDEPCEPSGDIFIDYNGKITRQGSTPSTIVLRGGYSLSKHTISDIYDTGFTLSVNQRQALSRILRELSMRTDRASITSPVAQLHEIANAIYRNYCG